MQIGLLGSPRQVITYRFLKVMTFFKVQDQSGVRRPPSQEFLRQCARDRVVGREEGREPAKMRAGDPGGSGGCG